MSVQYIADASQKFTCPVVNAVPDAFTVAVKVTTLPEATVVTGAMFELTVRVVAVTDFVCADTDVHNPQTTAASAMVRCVNLRWRLKKVRKTIARIGKQANQGMEITAWQLLKIIEPVLSAVDSLINTQRRSAESE